MSALQIPVCILNIGLGPATLFPETHTSEAKNLKYVAAGLRELGLGDRFAELHTSPTGESTVVLMLAIPYPGNEALLADIARKCRQDAIAAYWPEYEFGDLYGPNAAAWRPFNPALFVQPTHRMGGLLLHVKG